MKLAMAQQSMSEDMEENISRALSLAESAAGCDLLFYPEIQLSPFFPQYPGLDASRYLTRADDPVIRKLCGIAAKQHMYISPNFYMEDSAGKRFDRSLWITPEGMVGGSASMVHIFRAVKFYETDYYTPSEDGFKVFETPFGRVGIVICFDRHIPESIRTCALKGADLVIIPTANCKEEDMELFAQEIRVQAMQNEVFIAMCNRVGREGEMDFAGESIVADPAGNILLRADDRAGLITCDLDLKKAGERRAALPWLSLRRTDMYL